MVALSWFALAGAIVTSLAGQVLLKGAVDRQSFLEQLWDWRSLVGLLLYAAAALLFMFALRRIPLSVAVPFTALTYVWCRAHRAPPLFRTPEPSAFYCIGLISVGVILIGNVRI